MSKINIDGVEYVPASEAGPPPEWAIVVTQGGWNLVGPTTVNEDGSLVITDGRVIIYWGTTGGLGELAASGPTGKTKLGVPTTTRVAAAALLLTLDTRAELWS